jgi:Tol biopolymer transport system component
MHSTDKAKNERQSAIWLLQLDEQGLAVAEPRQLTSGVKNDTQPAWAPDSRQLLFISDREGEKSQLWLIDTDGGEARKLTNMLNGVSEAAWSPDGQWIAFTAMVSPTDDDEVLTGRKPLDEAEKKNATRKSASVSAPSRRSGTASMGVASSRNSTSFLSCLLPVMARSILPPFSG